MNGDTPDDDRADPSTLSDAVPPASTPSPIVRFFRWCGGGIRRKAQCRRTRLGLGACALYTIAIAIGLFHILPLLFDTPKVVAGLTRLVSLHLGSPVAASHVTWSMVDGPRLELTDVTITDIDGAAGVSAERLLMSLSLWDSFTKGLTLSGVTLVKPTIRLIREKDGSFNLPLADRLVAGAAGVDNGVAMIGAAAAAILPVDDLSVTQGTIRWIDRAIARKPVEMTISELTATLTRFGGHGQTRFTILCAHDRPGDDTRIVMTGIFGPDDDRESLIADVNLTSFPLGRYWPYLASRLPFDRLDADISLVGKIIVDDRGSYTANGRLTVNDVDIRFPEAFSVNVRRRAVTVDYRLAGTDDTLTVDEATMTLGPIVVSGNGRLTGLTGEEPQLAATLSTNDMPVTPLLTLLPDKGLTPQQAAFFTHNVKAGTVRLDGLTYTGPAVGLLRLEDPIYRDRFAGEMIVTDGRVAFDGLSHPFDRINGVATLDGSLLSLTDVSARYGASKIASIDGWIDDVHRTPTYAVALTADLDLAEARQILARQVISPALRDKLLGVTLLTGSVTADLSVAGDTRAPVESLVVDGAVALKDVAMEHPLLGIPLSRINGAIRGDSNAFVVDKLTWLAGSSPFAMSGRLRDPFKPAPSFTLDFGGTLHMEDIDAIALIPKRDALKRKSGFAQIDMTLDGRFDRFTVDNVIDLTDASLFARGFIDKRRGHRAISRFSGAVTQGRDLEVEKLDLTLGGSTIRVTGRMEEFMRGESLDVTIASDRVEADDIDAYFAFLDDIDSAGTAHGSMTVKSGPDRPVTLGGSIHVDGATFKLPIFAASFTDTSGDFELVGDHIFLKNAVGGFGSGAFSLSGGVELSSLPFFTLNVEASGLALYDLFGAPDDAPLPDPEPDASDDDSPNYFDGAWDIALHSTDGTIGFLTYDNLDARVTYKEDRFYVTPLTFEAHGGFWDAPLTVTLLDEGVGFDGKATIRDLALERYLAEAAASPQLITGRTNFSGAYTAEGARFADILRSVDGAFTLHADAGVIKRFNMLSKIFSLLNLSQYFKLKTPDLSVDGMPFDSVTGDFHIRRGVARTANLHVESEAIRLNGKGGYDLATGEVAMTIGAAPFVTVDRIVSAIPVAGYVLTGDEKNFLGSAFEVTGALNNPQVAAIPIESLARGALGILTRLVRLPVTAVEWLTETDDEVAQASAGEWH